MKSSDINQYLANCFLLLIPVFLWNIVYADALPQSYKPDIFDKDIPAIVRYTENVLRVITFTIPLLMPLTIKTLIQKQGFLIYLTGLMLYFTSWIFQLYYPDSEWSQSLLGFMAPAYTTIIWFAGIALIGNRSFLKIPHISLIYFTISTLFVVIHSIHAYLVFLRI